MSDIGVLVGVVSDQQGDPIAGVRVELSGPGYHRTQTTNSDGQFVFQPLEPGLYQLLATKEGYNPFGKPGIVIDPNKRTEVDIKMSPTQADE